MIPQPFHHPDGKVTIGVSGTGFIARGLLAALVNSEDFELGKVYSRREARDVESVDPDLLTKSMEELVETSDIVVESSGDVWRGAEVVDLAMKAGKPVVTMGTEFHVTVGSYFADRGYLTEAEGDQPGSPVSARRMLPSLMSRWRMWWRWGSSRSFTATSRVI